MGTRLTPSEIIRRIEGFHGKNFKVCDGQELRVDGRVDFICKSCGTTHSAPVLSLIYENKTWNCPACRKKRSDEHRLKLFLKLRGEDLELIEPSGVPGEWRKKTKVRCKRCGYEWSTSTHALLDQKKAQEGSGCPSCARIALSKGHARFLQKLKKVLPTLVVLDEYKNNYTKLRVRDTKCGHEWEATPLSLLARHGCERCARQKHFEELLRECRPNVQPLSEYVDSRLPIMVKCKICGHEWEAMPKSLLNHPSEFCAKCVKSRGEVEVAKVLDQYAINYITEYRFRDCKHVRPLPFDFYVPGYNTCIEYDGEQHYQNREFFGGESGYEKRKLNDSIKDAYCRDNNIALLRIPYTQLSNVEDVIVKYFRLNDDPHESRQN